MAYIGPREQLADAKVGVEAQWLIPWPDPYTGSYIDNFDSYTLTGDFLKPDGTTEVAVTPTLVAVAAGPLPKVVRVILTAADATPAGQWLLNLYAAAPGGNAQPFGKRFVFHVKAEWE